MFVYELQVAHANDAILGRWKTVDTLTRHQDYVEHIASPTFAWEFGTMVRVQRTYGHPSTLYLGAYNDSECINLMIGSEAYDRNPWSCNSKNLIEFWQGRTNGTFMLDDIRYVVSQQRLADCACALVDLLGSPRGKFAVHRDCLSLIREGGVDNARLVISRLRDDNDETSRMIVYAASIFTDPYYQALASDISRIIFTTLQQQRAISEADAQELIAEAVYQSIPFLEIVRGYITP